MEKRILLFVRVLVGLAMLGLVLVACSTPTPEVVEVEKVVTQIVKETVKETVVVEGTPQVVEKEVTRIVEVEKAEESEASEGTNMDLPKVVRLGFKREWPTLDPQNTTSSACGVLSNLVYQNLLQIDTTGNYVAGAAESWEASEDGMSMTFHLRPDLKRADGTALTAEDFAAPYRRAADPRNALKVRNEFMDILNYPEAANLAPETSDEDVEKALDAIGIEVVDDQTLVFHFNKPAASYFPFADYLYASFAAPVDMDLINENGEGWWTEAKNHNGNGPFMYEKLEDPTKIILVPNPYYWDADQIKLDRIEILFIEDDALLFEAYRNGELDIVPVGSDYLDVVERDDALNQDLFKGWLNQWNYFTIVARPPFDNVLVRKAFAYAFDKDGYNQDVLKGTAQSDNSLLIPGVLGYDENIHQVDYDPEMAVATLIEAGYGAADSTPENPKIDCDKLGEIVLTYKGSAENNMTYQYIAGQYINTFGCPVTLDPVEETTAASIETNPLISLGFSNRTTLYVEDYFGSYRCKGNVSGWVARWTGYCDEEMTDILDQAKAEKDTVKQDELYKEANRMLMDSYILQILGRQFGYYLVKPQVIGLKEGFYFGDSVFPGAFSAPETWDVDLTLVGKNYPTQ